MKLIKNITTILALMMLLAVSVSAQPELPNPGITPDSPFYFIEGVFDVFRSNEAIMDKRASEIVAMAEKGHERGLAKAMEGYEKALEKRKEEAENDENIAEEVARQSSNHLAVLSRVREQVSEQAREGIDKAINKGAKSRENALQALNEKNPERAGAVAVATLQEVIANAPEQAQKGLQNALEAVKAGGKGPAQSGEANLDDILKVPKKQGKPSDIPAGNGEESELEDESEENNEDESEETQTQGSQMDVPNENL